MKYLLPLLVIFTACCVKKEKVLNQEKTSVEAVNTIQDSIVLCDTEFRQFLLDSLKYVERPTWFPHVVLKRNDNFVKMLQEKYAKCLKGKSSNRIIELFGKPRSQSAESMTYDCIFKDEDAQTGVNAMCLIFRLDENLKVKYISYYDCWGRQ